jgi:hypothetical protein
MRIPGDSTIGQWFKKDFPSTKRYPHKSDYCGDCDGIEKKIQSHQVIINMPTTAVCY